MRDLLPTSGYGLRFRLHLEHIADSPQSQSDDHEVGAFALGESDAVYEDDLDARDFEEEVEVRRARMVVRPPGPHPFI